MNAVSMNVINFVIKLAFLGFSTYVINKVVPPVVEFLKQKNLYNKIVKLVLGVEQLANSGQINKLDKKKLVIEALTSMGVEVDTPTEYIIEAVVNEYTNTSKKVVDAFVNSNNS